MAEISVRWQISSQTFKEEEGTMNEKMMLVVDDDETLRQIVAEILAQYFREFEIMTAPDGEIGWEMIKKHYPRLVISDVHMPKKSGIELLFGVVKDFPDIEIILMSGDMAREEAIALGAQHFLNKPFKIKELVDDVTRIIYRKELRHD